MMREGMRCIFGRRQCLLKNRMTTSDATTWGPLLVQRKKDDITIMGAGTIQCWIAGKEGGAPYLATTGNL